MTKEIELVSNSPLSFSSDELQLIGKELVNVREEVRDNPYLAEAHLVLQAGGLRSAIGSYWNGVVDDLRQKVLHRSLDLFNKEVETKRTVKKYEDFQDFVSDFDLIEGCYKIGVLGWEAKKILHQARETRNIFDGHPKSDPPSLIKVLNFLCDCNKYVLSQDPPPIIVDIETYIRTMDSDDYDRNEMAIEQALIDLPEVYKTEMAHKLYRAYTHEGTSTVLRANIEFCAPVLWRVLPKEVRNQIGKRFDREMLEGNKVKTQKGIDYLSRLNGLGYISTTSRRCIFEPLITNLENNLDNWKTEGKVMQRFFRLGTNIPQDLTPRYVSALTKTYVGYKGASARFNRTDFYSNTAAPYISKIFEKLDDSAVEEFMQTVKTDDTLKRRVRKPDQLQRLRTLANILLQRDGIRPDLHEFLDLVVDEDRTEEFMDSIR